MKRLGKLAGCLLGLALLAGQAQAEDPVLRWLVAEGPVEGALGDEADANRVLRELLWPSLPGWRHQWVTRTPERLARDMQGPEASCALHLRPAAEARPAWLLSGPWLRRLPVGVVLRQADARRWSRYLNWRGEVALEALLLHEGATAAAGAQAYGPGIDPVLQRQAAERVRRLQLDSARSVALAMVARAQGVDAAFADPVQLAHFERMQPELAGHLRWLPVQGQPETLPTTLGCSRNEPGQRALAQLDALLQRPEVRERLQGLYEARLPQPERERLQMLRSRLGEGFWREGAWR